MDWEKELNALREERKLIGQAITALELLRRLRGVGPGRRSMGAEERREVAERMRKYWEKRRAEKRRRATA